MATTYAYSITTDFVGLSTPGVINIGTLTEEILASGIVPVFNSITVEDDDVIIEFATSLSGPEEATLDGIVVAHTGDPSEGVEQSGGTLKAESLTYADTGNAVLGPLFNEPVELEDVTLFVHTGVIQEYTLDYTVRKVAGGSDPGFYICLSPTSTAPGGGVFDGGSNPGTGIAPLLSFGDTTRVIYPL